MYNMHPHISTQHYSALLRRNSRRLERKYRHTGSATDRLPSVEHERMCHKVYRHKESAFWNAQLTDNVEHVSHHSRRTKVQTTANQHPVGPRLSRLIQQEGRSGSQRNWPRSGHNTSTSNNDNDELLSALHRSWHSQGHYGCAVKVVRTRSHANWHSEAVSSSSAASYHQDVQCITPRGHSSDEPV